MRPPHSSGSPSRGCALLLFTLLPLACNKPPAAAPPQTPVVTVAKPVVREVTDWDVYPGRLAAAEAVEIRARVGGFITEAPFKEGTVVKKGDLLFVIDERPYKAELDQAKANLAQSQAQQRYAEDELRRLEPLRGSKAISESDYVAARRTAEQAKAAVQASQAAVSVAELNLQWCRVTAPITGKVSRIEVTPGNLITGGTAQGTLLTSITSIDPIYCYVNIDENAVRNYQRINREQHRPNPREVALACELRVGNEGPFDIKGKLDFIDNRIDPATATIRCRGNFPNPTGELLPGFYADLRIPGRGPYQALLVPEEAVGTTQAQRYVLTVGPDDKVQYRVVTTGDLHEGLRAVEGIGPEDRVIVKGIVQARPGAVVKATEVPAQSLVARQSNPSTRPTTPGSSVAGSGNQPGRPGTGSNGQGSAVPAAAEFGPANTNSGPAGVSQSGRGGEQGGQTTNQGAQQGGGVNPGGAGGQGSAGGTGR